MVDFVFDLVLESFRTLILLVVIIYLWISGEDRAEFARTGWRFVFGGFLLLLFGSAIDITNNFESLNRFVFIGDTELEAFLENIVGFLGGFLLLAIGLIKWIPTVTSLEKKEELSKELEKANRLLTTEIYERERAEKYLTIHKNSLKKTVEKRTSELVNLNEQLKQEIQERRLAENKYRMIFDNVNDAIYIHDIVGPILEVNNVTCEMMGYSRDELLDMAPSNFNSPEYAALIPKNVDISFQKGYAIFETIYIRKDGSQFPVEISSRIIDYAGRKAVLNVARDISERKKAEEVRKKDLLLKEIHHRVKNNLQVIASLLNLQSRGFDEQRLVDAFKESQNRVRSMAIAHEKLYQSENLDSIDFSDYIKNLTNHLFYSYRVGHANVRLNAEVDSVHLGIEQVVPLGLIINELVTNSLKYAFAEGQEGEINIDFHLDDGMCKLIVSDNGVGLPEGVDFRETDSLGLQVVTTLVEQIDGDIELDNSEGTKFIIMFKQ